LEIMVEPEGGTGPSFEEDLAYLLLFSEALLDLVPDGVAVLDDRLRVRNANRAFVKLLGLGTIEAARGVCLSDEPLFRATVFEREDRPLGDVLAASFESDIGLTVEVPVPDGVRSAQTWSVRAAPWDTEHPSFRRILLCVRRSDPAARIASPTGVREDAAPHPFTVTGWTQEVLELLPVGVCVLDPSHRVRALNGWLEGVLSRPVSLEDCADRHLFALFPELRSQELTDLLGEARHRPDWVQSPVPVVSASGADLTLDAQVRAFIAGDGEVSEILVIFRDGARASLLEPSEPPPPDAPPPPGGGDAGWEGPPGSGGGGGPGDEYPEPPSGWEPPDEGNVPVRPEDIVAPGNLSRFPHAATSRILIVEADPWTRMVISVSLRQAGFEDLSLAETRAAALETLDPAALALMIVGWDRDPEDARDFCLRVAGTAPGVPILGVTEHGPDEAREFGRGLPLLGFLPGPVLSDDLRQVVAGVLRTPEPAEPSEPVRRPPRTLSLVILGAGKDEVSVLRHLYRVQRIDIRMVWDSDPDAFGISLAKNLGIPTITGGLTLGLESPPDAVVLARDGLEPRLTNLGLDTCPRITRGELELFLVDPESFLGTERGSEPVSGPESSPTMQAAAAPTYTPEPEPPAPLPAREPARETPTPMAVDELVAGAPEMNALLGALDLLMDFERLCARVVEIAIESVDGSSGSLMLVSENGRYLRIAASSGLSEMVVRNTRVPLGEGVAGSVAEQGMPLLLTGALGEDDFFPGKEKRPEIVSALTIPVFADQRIIGVINVNARPAGPPFDEDHLSRLSELGQRVGDALERSRQLRLMRGRTFETSVRAEIESLAATGDDLLSRFRRIASRVVDLLEVDTCVIYLYDVKRRELSMHAVAGISTASMDAVTVPVDTGLAGWVAGNLRPLLLQSAPGFAPGHDVPFALAVPIRYQTEFVGVLSVECTRGAAADEERVPIFEVVASVIGQAIGESRDRVDSERKMTMLSALSELGPAFASTLERGSLARLVTFSATTLLGSDVSTIRLLVPGGTPGATDLGAYELLAAHGASAGPNEPIGELEQRIAREVIATNRTVRESNLREVEIEPFLTRSNVAAALGVPMLTEDRLVGVLMFFRVKDSKGRDVRFRESEIEIGTRLGDYAAAAATRFVFLDRGRTPAEGGA
jgi:GAF domain-containing protein/PAS domain-containing protein/CheY-like chemotaxis protein